MPNVVHGEVDQTPLGNLPTPYISLALLLLSLAVSPQAYAV